MHYASTLSITRSAALFHVLFHIIEIGTLRNIPKKITMAVVRHYYQTPGHVIAAGIALSLLDIAVVSMRFASRIKTKQSLKADDWLLLPATVRFSIVYFIVARLGA